MEGAPEGKGFDMNGELQDIDDLKKCECCGEVDLYEYMKNRPDGYYCISCFEDIFE